MNCSVTTRALILSDGRPGHFNQSIALCRLLGVSFEVVEVSFRSSLARGLSHLFDFFGMHFASLFWVGDFEGEFQLVVSAGSRTYYANKVLAAKLGARSVAVLAPRGYRWDYDCLVIPEYDEAVTMPQVVSIPVNLSYIDEQLTVERVAAFRKRHPASEKLAWGVIIGGDSSSASMDVGKMSALLDRIELIRDGVELWVTTSPRTPVAVETDLRKRSIDFLHLYSEEAYNPIPAFVQLCDRLFVTGDSTAMLSECVTAGTSSVDVLQVAKMTKAKQHRFVRFLADRGSVAIFGEGDGPAMEKVDLSEVAAQVRECLALRESLT